MKERPLILIVDDEQEFLEIMSAKFSASGFDPVVAHSAKEGVDAAAKVRPDLVLMDIHMPGGETGTDAALEIKQNPETKNTKIAFLSSLKNPWMVPADERDRLAKELGMVEYIDKTEDLGAIVAKAREILAGARR